MLLSLSRDFQSNNTKGAFGVGVANGLAIIPSQWGWSGTADKVMGYPWITPYRKKIHGEFLNGKSLFKRITDIQDDRGMGKTTQLAQEAIMARYDNNLVLEIYGGRASDGPVGVRIFVPIDRPCPHGTVEQK
jgi:hypothetical protein